MFKVQELIDQQTYAAEADQAINHIHPKALETLNAIKAQYGLIMVINTWHMKYYRVYGEMRNFSGFRPAGCNIGKPDGAHYKGMAFDVLFFDAAGNFIHGNTIRAKIMADIHLFPHIQCLEIGISWVHVDVMGQIDSKKRIGCDGTKVMLVDTKNNVTWFNRQKAA